MGIVLWVVSGCAAFLIARIVPIARGRAWIELPAATVVAVLCGVLATALDFGGWKELDWRAALFSFLGAMTAIGVIRAARRRSPPPPAAAAPPGPPPARW